MRLFATILVVCALVLPIPAHATTWHVPSECPTIQAGIDSASAGDTVLVACGTYYEHGITIRSDIYLRSETGQPGCVTIDAQWQGEGIICRVSWPYNGTPTIEGFTITRGEGTDGGAVRCDFLSATLINCVLFDNAGRHGGAIGCEGASVALINCTLSHNWAEFGGGGMYCDSNYPSTVENTIIAFSSHGEAVYSMFGGECATLICCDVFGNAGGDWVDCIADQYGINGNISEDPLFCDPEDANFWLLDCSPCVHGYGCGQIGPLGVGCVGPTAAEQTTWSSLRLLYR